MRELSLHVLDIIQNSIAADATLVKLDIIEDIKGNKLVIKIEDNGKGIKEEDQERVTDPFVTSRDTREVGLGLSLLEAASEQCEGNMNLESKDGQGTKIKAEFKYNHIDRAPLGDIASTITSLLASNPDFDIIYQHWVDQKKFEINTKDIRKELKDVNLNNTRVLNWIDNYIKTNIEEIHGGE